MSKGVIWVSIVAVALMGCATKTQTGALVGTGAGAAVGAGVGQAVGRSTSSTLLGAAIGAAVGGLAGGAIGHYMDQQEQSMRQALANSEAASVRREQEVLAVTFKSDYLFATNSSALQPGARDEVERVAGVLKQYPDTMVQIAGHTDSTGSEEYNKRLSERRAETVRIALMGMGVDPRRMTAVGFGESKPIASNGTEAGRQQNRRVEIRIIPEQKQG